MSNLTGKDEAKSMHKENIERLETAYIKMEAVLQVSDRWQITSAPLLQWQSNLKRAAEECNNTLLRCKQRILEEEQMREKVSQSSFPKRIALATKSYVSSFIGNSNDEPGSNFSNIQRFERYANVANEFLKTIKFGGTLRSYTFFNPLVRHLLTGKFVRYQTFKEDKLYHLNLRPMSSAERGVEAMMGFSCQDFKEPKKGFYVACMLRLSESIDIFNVIIKCIQAVAPHFKFDAEGIRRELIELPLQDFTWDSSYNKSEFWVNVHNTITQWHRPNPLCCNEHNLEWTSSSSTSNINASSWLFSNIFPEEVINIHFKWHVPLVDQQTNYISSTAALHACGGSSQNFCIPALKLGILVIPHESSEDIELAADSYALEVIDGKEQGIVHTDARLQDLGDKLLPKAIEYLHQNSESKMYQMSLKSRHGTAHLCVERASIQIRTISMVKSEATRRAQKKRTINLQQDRERWKQVSEDLLKLWVVRGSDKLQGSILGTRNWT